jgi:hypothetical protein
VQHTVVTAAQKAGVWRNSTGMDGCSRVGVFTCEARCGRSCGSFVQFALGLTCHRIIHVASGMPAISGPVTLWACDLSFLCIHILIV